MAWLVCESRRLFGMPYLQLVAAVLLFVCKTEKTICNGGKSFRKQRNFLYFNVWLPWLRQNHIP